VAATVPPLDTVRRTIFGRSTREGPIAAGAS
jgi:hypothetical protein